MKKEQIIKEILKRVNTNRASFERRLLAKQTAESYADGILANTEDERKNIENVIYYLTDGDGCKEV